MFSMNNWQPSLKKMFWLAVSLVGLIVIVLIILAINNLGKNVLTIKADLTPATIAINGNTAGQTPLTIRLADGTYKISAKYQEKTQEKQVNLANQENSFIFFNFNELTGPQKQLKALELTKVMTETLNFVIEPGDQTNYDLKITLYAVFNARINGPSIAEQQAQYVQELKDYKAEALAWVKTQGFEPAKLKIQWFPEEAEHY